MRFGKPPIASQVFAAASVTADPHPATRLPHDRSRLERVISDRGERETGTAVTEAASSPARERVIERLVAAARPLFAEKGPSKVSLREIASAAGVNYGLIHHYVGTKDDLLEIVLQRASTDWVDYFVDAPTVDDAVTHIMRPKSSEYARIVAQAILAGAAPETLLGRSPALAALTKRIEEDSERPCAPGDDARVYVAAITGMALGWGLYGRYVQEIAGLGDRPENDVTEAVYALLRRAMDHR